MEGRKEALALVMGSGDESAKFWLKVLNTSATGATLEWVHWFNTERLHSALGDIPPDEFEAASTLPNSPTRSWLESNSPSLHETQGDSVGFGRVEGGT